MEENEQNQQHNKQDQHKNSSNPLENNQEAVNPPGGGEKQADLKADSAENTETELFNDATRYADEVYEREEDRHDPRFCSPLRPRHRKRYVGALNTMGDYRREMAALYKEAYYGNIPWGHLTRATYALVCMMQAAAMEKPDTKTRKKRDDAGKERR